MPLILAAVSAAWLFAADADDAKVAQGKQVYAEQRCRLCHSIEGQGNPKGPHDGIGSRLSPEQMRQWILDPLEMAKKAKATRKPPMPSFEHLTPQELDALVAYLQTLKKK